MTSVNFNWDLLTLSILCLPLFLSARGDDYSTAQVSTSWVNNDISAVNTTISAGPYMRIILLKEITKDTGFAFGFVSNYTPHGVITNHADNRFYSLAVAVVTKIYWSNVFGVVLDAIDSGWLTSSKLVWVANKRKNILENATLSLLPDGNLVLWDSDGRTLIWSTNTRNKSVVGIKLTERGNLVLYDSHNHIVWQSSDYSEDTLLDGQKLVAGKKLVARTSVNDTREGESSYYLSVTSQGLFAFYKSQMYFKFLVPGTSYVKSRNGTLGLYTSLNEHVSVFPTLIGILLFMTLDSDGRFRAYTKNGPVDLLANFLTRCDYPMVCGNYGLCSSEGCSCPAGYTRDSASGVCKEVNPRTCDDKGPSELVPLNNVSHFSYVDSGAAAIQGADLESCKQVCLRNCSCKVALFRYFLNDSHGDCYLPSPVRSLINDGIKRGFYQSLAFIKIPNRNLISVVSSGSFKRKKTETVPIALSSVGTFIIIVMVAIGIWMVCFREESRGIEKDGDDNFEEIAGMPSRFSYQELKMATNDFQIKLGEGGFGSVFEGQLSQGEKVAVKRLDGLSQGRKEFLAEVQTIGSIHHVNLVRLVGFCAEKSNRLLVYEFMYNRSLDKWIFRGNDLVEQLPMNWELRKNIILDIAKGLAYLHEECRQRIVHLDIKPQNILLDSNFRAKVSDFGLSRFIDRDQSQIITTMRGTPGYLAPEWLTSTITEKADVYSYGIVVMEVVCGRKNLDRSQPEEFKHLLSLFKEKAEADQLVDLIDKCAFQDMESEQLLEAVKMMRLAAWCLQGDYTRRPSMSVAVKVIEGTMEIDPNLDYSFPNPIVNVGIHQMKTTVTLLPSILSAPR